MEEYATNINEMIIKFFLETNKDGISDMEQTKEWDTATLLDNTLTASRQIYKMVKEDGLIDNVEEYIDTIVDTLVIANKIGRSLEKQLKETPKERKVIYHEDPDDPPIPKIEEMLMFNECENYMTIKGFVKFDLEYMLNGINEMNKRKNPYGNIQFALDEAPDIPMNEYIWYCCPLEPEIGVIQLYYYSHWMNYNEFDKVSK
jgi:hypothetical protein